MDYLQIAVNEPNSDHRRVYFNLGSQTGAGGTQANISINGAAYSSTGISTITHLTAGQYYATLTQAVLAHVDDVIIPIVTYSGTKYEGSTVQVVRPSWFTVKDAVNTSVDPADSGEPENNLRRGYVLLPTEQKAS